MLNALLFLVTYFSSLVLSVASNPIYAFLGYQVVYFFNPARRWWGSLIPGVNYSFIIVVLMLLLLFMRFGRYKQNNPFASPPLRWMYVLIALFIAVSGAAVFPELHREAAVDFIKLGVTITAAYMLCVDKKHLDYLLYGYLFGVWYLAFVAFQTGRNVGGRVEGIGPVDSPDANGMAAGLVPSIVIALYYIWLKKNIYQRGLIIMAAAFSANALVLVNSRGSFLGVASSLAYFFAYMLFSKVTINNQKKVAMGIIMLTLLGASIIVDQAFIERMLTIKQTELVEDQETGATRVFFWLAAWEMAKDYPFGQGYSGFIYHADNYIPTHISTGSSRSRAVHSIWFEALTQVGFPGAFVLLLMLSACFWGLRKLKKKIRDQGGAHGDYYKVVAIEAGLLGYLITATFINRMRAEILYWCILYCAVAYNLYYLKALGISDARKSARL